MNVADVALGRRPGLAFPAVSLLLLAGCVVATVPMYFDPHLYEVLGADAPSLEWWHRIETAFVHGGGPPGTTVHLAINGSFLLLFAVPAERLLGRARFFLLTLATTAGAVTVSLVRDVVGNGISGTSWGYAAFGAAIVVSTWRHAGLRAARDPITVLASLGLVVALLGLVVSWHAVSIAVALPILMAWRRPLAKNLASARAGDPPDMGSKILGALAIAITAAVVLFVVGCTAAGVLGWLE